MGKISFDNLTVNDEIFPPLDATSLPKTTTMITITTTTTTTTANDYKYGIVVLFSF